MKKKKIWDYFEDIIEFPKEVANDPIPYGIAWQYISVTFLNGFINYVKPISCFVLGRYSSDDAEITSKFGNIQWHGTKKQLIDLFNSGEKMYHTELSCFKDDVIVLAKIETEKDENNKYMFFWFDMDVSDCCIGRFITEDSEEEIKQSVVDYLDEILSENQNVTIDEGLDNGIVNYREIPVLALSGWMRF